VDRKLVDGESSKASKGFFFEKKKQKNFRSCGLWHQPG